ncbi:MAG TPA: NAD(P)H-dependent oxidoreductase [Candidatus Kapabacteria bacterium]
MALKVLGISGSLKPNSSTSFVINLALEAAREKGAEIEFCEVSTAGLPFCDGRPDEDYPEAVHEFRTKIRESQGIIIGTPEYHNSLTGWLKNALDLCGHNEFEHKMVGLIGVAGGAMGAINSINHLRTIMRGVGAWSVPHQVSISNSGHLFSGPNQLADAMLEKRIKKLGYDVVKFASMLTHGLLQAEDLS